MSIDTQSIVKDAINALSPLEKDLILEDFVRCLYDGRLMDSVNGWNDDGTPSKGGFDWSLNPHPPIWHTLRPLFDMNLGFHDER